MQIGLSIIFFFVGFAVATAVALRPRKARQDLETFASRLRHVTNGLKGEGYHAGDLKQSEISPDVMEDGKDLLLTKYGAIPEC